MIHLLNLLAAIALLVWGTHIVRTGVLRVFGESLRAVLARSVRQGTPRNVVSSWMPPESVITRAAWR